MTTPIDDMTPIEPEEFIRQLRRLRERVPYYGQLTTSKKRSMIRIANLDEDFVQEGVNGVGTATRVENAVGWTAEAMQQEIEASNRWTAVVTELNATALGVSGAILTRRYRIGMVVLQAYAFIQNLVRRKGNEDLIPAYLAMKSVNRFGHKRPKAEDKTTPAPKNDAEKR